MGVPTTTSLEIVAGAGNAQVSVGIEGRWRYNTATVTAAVPGGLAVGDHPIFVTSQINNSSQEDAGTFNYSFFLVPLAAGSTPTGTGNQAIYRQIGTFHWDGTVVDKVNQSIGVPGTVSVWEVGDLKPTAAKIGAGTEPTGWLLCDGRAVSRTTYATLWSRVQESAGSSPYGNGDGTTTFNLPDYRGRVPVGQDNFGTAAGAASRLTSNNTRGASSGAATHTLSTGEMPAHTHTINSATTGVTTANGGSHSHTGTTASTSVPHTHDSPASPTNNGYLVSVSSGGTQFGGGTGTTDRWNTATVTGAVTAATSTAHTHTFTTSTDTGHTHTITDPGHVHTETSAGGGGAHNNMQPYQVCNWLVRVLA